MIREFLNWAVSKKGVDWVRDEIHTIMSGINRNIDKKNTYYEQQLQIYRNLRKLGMPSDNIVEKIKADSTTYDFHIEKMVIDVFAG